MLSGPEVFRTVSPRQLHGRKQGGACWKWAWRHVCVHDDWSTAGRVLFTPTFAATHGRTLAAMILPFQHTVAAKLFGPCMCRAVFVFRSYCHKRKQTPIINLSPATKKTGLIFYLLCL